MADDESNKSQIIEVAEIAWESMMPNIKAKMLWTDTATKRRAQLIRFEPGASLPLHRHVGDELLYMIEGSISDESGTVSAGSVHHNLTRHFAPRFQLERAALHLECPVDGVQNITQRKFHRALCWIDVKRDLLGRR